MKSLLILSDQNALVNIQQGIVLFTMFTIWYPPSPQRAQDNAEARLDGPTTDMSGTLAGLALRNLRTRPPVVWQGKQK